MKKDYKGQIILLFYILCLLFVVLTFLFALCRPINKIMNKREFTVIVTDKAVKNSDSGSKYLIYAEDDKAAIQVFEITDSLLALRFNSSDVYAALKVGHRYKLTVSGSRNRLLSWYPNIMEYELIE